MCKSNTLSCANHKHSCKTHTYDNHSCKTHTHDNHHKTNSQIQKERFNTIIKTLLTEKVSNNSINKTST